MAGDWIKMRGNLWDDPRISALVDATNTSEAAVVGGLYWLWASADQHSEDGLLPGLTLRQIDRKTSVAGLGQALVSIGWLQELEGGVSIPHFDEHNGASAKKRAQTAKRVAKHEGEKRGLRQKAESTNALSVSPALAREREEIEKEKRNLQPTDARKKSAKQSRLAAGFVPIESGVKAAAEAGLNVQAELQRFRDYHESKGSTMADWQAAWRTWVTNAIAFGRSKPVAAKADDSWLAATGFDTADEARNFGCQPSTAHLFREGRRITESA